MYKHVFRNSKVALLFAGMTLFSAVSMIGTPEDKGALTEAVDLVESSRQAAERDAQAGAQGYGAAGTPPVQNPVFGEFDSASTPAANVTAAAPGQAAALLSAPISSTAMLEQRGATDMDISPMSEGGMPIQPE
jgi:hypothetical protein